MIAISTLIGEMEEMEAIAQWIDQKNDPVLGVELIAFTHDEAYWQRLVNLLPRLSCGVSFHGPYVGIEGAALPGSQAQADLFASYEKVMALAAQYEGRHIVFHYSQRGFSEEERPTYQAASQENIAYLLQRAKHYGVSLLVENLADPLEGKPLYDLFEFEELIGRFPEIGVIIDIGHAILTGMWLKPLMIKYGKQVKAFHFHNNNGLQDQHRSITDGIIEYDEIVQLYRNHTPGRDIVLEYEPHVSLSHEELLAQVAWVKENSCL